MKKKCSKKMPVKKPTTDVKKMPMKGYKESPKLKK